MDVEVGGVVDVRDHSVDLFVDLWIDGREVKQRFAAIQPRGMKPVRRTEACETLVE